MTEPNHQHAANDDERRPQEVPNKVWQAWLTSLSEAAPSAEFDQRLQSMLDFELGFDDSSDDSTDELINHAANHSTQLGGPHFGDRQFGTKIQETVVPLSTGGMSGWLERASETGWGRVAICLAAFAAGLTPFLYAMMTFHFFF